MQAILKLSRVIRKNREQARSYRGGPDWSAGGVKIGIYCQFEGEKSRHPWRLGSNKLSLNDSFGVGVMVAFRAFDPFTVAWMGRVIFWLC